MTQRISTDPITKKPSEVLLVSVDFTLYGLRTSELLTGTPTITTPSGITTSNPAVNTSPFVNQRGKTVAVGKGVQFVVSGGTAGQDYQLDVSCPTNGSTQQTLDVTCPVFVRSYD